MTSQLAVDALCNAVAVRGPAETIVHSDRGSQFRFHSYQRALHGEALRGDAPQHQRCWMDKRATPSVRQRIYVHGLGACWDDVGS
jgi:hypothetical protein